MFARSSYIKPILSSLFLWAMIAAQAHAANDRLALIIGNSAYQHVSALDNPANDAADISVALEKAGFDVDTRFDLDQQGMLRALQEFGQRSIGAEMAVIYYAGHGIEVARQNYLIPVSARLSTDIDVAFETVQLDRALLAVAGAKRLRLVIVDACRDNPFAGQMRSTSPTRSIGRGLAAVEPSAATLVAYAAKEGTVANDGRGRNSPYAAALLEVLAEPGLEIGKLFRRVRDTVLRETGGTQEPFVYGSIPAYDLFLYPAALTEDVIETDAPAPTAQAPALDLAFWNAISNSSDPRDFQDFVERFPNSVFAGLAARRIEILSPEAETIPETNEQFAALPEPDAALLQNVAPGEPLVLSRDLLRGVQLQLNALGHSAGTPDGIMGRRTRGGIESFRSTRGLTTSDIEIDRPLVEMLGNAISVDRASLDHYIVDRFGTSTRAGRYRGLYCLDNGDGTQADGKDGREMLCHYVRPSRGRMELSSYYSHVRRSPDDPVIGITTRLRRVDGDAYVSDDGTPFTLTASEIVQGPNLFQRVE